MARFLFIAYAALVVQAGNEKRGRGAFQSPGVLFFLPYAMIIYLGRFLLYATHSSLYIEYMGDLIKESG